MDKIHFIERLIKDIINLYDKDGSIKGDNVLRYRELLYILGFLLWHEKNILKKNTEKERSILEKAIHKIKEENIKSITYEKIKSIITQLYKSESESQEYYVLFTYNLSEKNMRSFSKVSFKQIPIEIVKLKDYILEIGKCQDPLLYDNLRIYHNNYWIKIKIKASSSDEALNLGYFFSEYIRALINFYLTENKFFILEYPPQPKSIILPSKYYFALDKNEEYCNYWLTVGDYKFREQRLSDDKINEIIKLIKEVDGLPENESKKIFLDSVYLYCIAMDDTNYSYSYIVLWSIIERIVKNIFASDAEEKNKLKNTLKNIYEEDKILFNLISALYEKRNSMIHGGNLMDIELDDINWIKLIVCDLLSRTFRKLKDN